MFGWRRNKRAAPPPAVPADIASAADADALLQRLEWTVVRRLDGLLQGDYRTLLRGFGLDVADLREYRPGDDVRHIDWNATARLSSPHVREFQEDREVAAWFLLDLSGSVDFGSGAVRKRAMLDDFTAVMARLLVKHGNRIGAVLYGGAGQAPSVVPVRAGRRHLLHLLSRMRATRAAASKGGKKAQAEGGTRLADLLAHAQAVATRRGVVFVVSDFISEPGWEAPLGMLARRHEVVAVRLVDPLELSLPDLGLVVLQDAESGEQMFVDTHDAGFRKRFEAAAESREAGLREVFARAGVDCLVLPTDARLDLALLRFARQRSRERGGRRGPPVATPGAGTPGRAPMAGLAGGQAWMRPAQERRP
ncbi:Uncharacterized conserved protein (some members contain a von Willebrand factor type A (vWA) domain) [Bordetella ansorpii]|uniref:Uncharacterized conserved protein (Some members contain a von Willebrand factor type A (VWA) domain) n=1 Tax=Bordetella ansorpii TaxID=288768 RepID=A0A157SXV2_9BORD|nr:DUF58 domain-containing protein [Bordetella ansorpii]SAI74776.1 Uncharacterized conserved protein (some members contain a von Willebrand factor type A (vWA) domain) [Bordetella ansorpii]